ncbi:amino acid adenylation domain-containing protein [Tumebacillus sp. BK434]|uniref:non-ribosomal peptide synthetase n=1 Tax=Tumebacillus sp. BK434 TaxID=2512169 RepID=UPI0010437E22|nr:non-ribosomal peptide synthetase [Tumebacillus sp. BK434]TCP59052.1 amino acid adenylation domain-containing protein [Tumebacillus sp. BK434]
MDKRANLTPAQRALLEKRIKGKGPVMPASTQKKTGIPRRPKGESPLSFSQERIWIMEQLEPDAAVYNLAFVVTITGEIDREVLGKSIHEVVRRHEALRTTFPVRDGTPTLQVHEELPVPILALDVRLLPEEEREEAAERLALEDARRPFDLVQGPLVRVTTIQKTDQESLLLITMHHIISDDWSLGVLINEFSILYASYKNGLPSPLAELPIHYSDFAYWQKQPEQQASLQKQFDYWHEQLGGDREPLQLPTDRLRPASQTYNGARTVFRLSRQLSAALQQLSVESGTTLFMTLLAAYQTFLARYTGQSDILVGSPIANRNRQEIEGLVGVFINTLVHRSRIAQGMTFRELLGNVRRTTLDAFANQDIPFEKLVERLEQDRNLAYPPLFQTLFSLLNNAERTLSMPGLTLQTETLYTQTVSFDITLTIYETGQGLEGYWDYNTDLFDPETVERMILHFQTLLGGIVDHPDQLVHKLPILPANEQHKMLRDWNETAFPSRAACLHQLFEAQVERSPDAIAVVFEDQQITYRALNNRANQMAQFLQAFGVGPDERVGIFMDRSPDLLTAMIAAHKAGGAYLPLDPGSPQDRLGFMIGDAQPKVILTQPSLAGRLPEHESQVLTLRSEEPSLFLPNPVSLVQPEHLAYIIYTSGSTGRPKGVMVEHQSAAHFFTGMDQAVGCGSEDVMLAVTSIGFDISVLELFWSLARGATVILLSETEIGEAGISVREYSLRSQLLRHQATILQCTPSLMGMILAAPDGPAALAPLQKILLGGEAMPPALARHLKQKTNARLFNMYGPTEATVWSAVHVVDEPDLQTSIPLGRPIVNCELYILDEHLQPVPVGVGGELHIGGAGVTRGYLGRPELTAERFIANPFGAGRLYKTGDRASFLPDGSVKFLGRFDSQVKLRGFRIELGEIEAVLDQHPAVVQAVATVYEGEVLGVYYSGEKVPSIDLRAYLKERLPAYMIPSAYLHLDKFPLTATGKINHRLLPTPETEERIAEYVEPRTPTEKKLVGIWSELLRVEKISVYDHFFDLGGHSLLATKLHARMQLEFSIELNLRDLFEKTTIAELAEAIQAVETVRAPVIQKRERIGSRNKR